MFNLADFYTAGVSTSVKILVCFASSTQLTFKNYLKQRHEKTGITSHLLLHVSLFMSVGLPDIHFWWHCPFQFKVNGFVPICIWEVKSFFFSKIGHLPDFKNLLATF
jgi:hypothetical protein